MTFDRKTETELLYATIRRLKEQGYDVIVEPSTSILPNGLRHLRPDAVAIGKEPKLLVEIASEGSHSSQRIAEMQQALKAEPEWKLHLVLNRASGSPVFSTVSDPEINKVLEQARHVANIDARGALLMAWAAFEALSRGRGPDEFSRAQSPGRLIERLASHAIISPKEAEFFRSMANHRNRFIHGDLIISVTTHEVISFIHMLTTLVSSRDFSKSFS